MRGHYRVHHRPLAKLRQCAPCRSNNSSTIRIVALSIIAVFMVFICVSWTSVEHHSNAFRNSGMPWLLPYNEYSGNRRLFEVIGWPGAVPVRLPVLGEQSGYKLPADAIGNSLQYDGLRISLLLPPKLRHGGGNPGFHPVSQGLTLHHLATARLLANASKSVTRPWDSRSAVPLPLCAGLARQSDGDQRSHDVLEAGALPHMICFFYAAIALGVRRQARASDGPGAALAVPVPAVGEGSGSGAVRTLPLPVGTRAIDIHTTAISRDLPLRERVHRLPILPPTRVAARAGGSGGTRGRGGTSGRGEAAGQRAHASRCHPRLLGATVLATRWYSAFHLAHWLLNGYLPALDHWLNLGAPRPLVLAILPNYQQVPTGPNAGYGGSGLWPADGFGEHTVLLTGFGAWPEGLPTTSPDSRGTSDSNSKTGRQTPAAVGQRNAVQRWGRPPPRLVTDIFVARELAAVSPGDRLGHGGGWGSHAPPYDSKNEGGHHEDEDEDGHDSLCLERVHVGMPPATPAPYSPIQIRRRTAAVARVAAWRAAGAAPVSVLENTREGGWKSLEAGGFVPGVDPEQESLFRSRVWAVPGSTEGGYGALHEGSAAVPSWMLQYEPETRDKAAPLGASGNNRYGDGADALQRWAKGPWPHASLTRVIRVLWLYRTGWRRSQSNLHQTLGAVLGIAPEDLVLPSRVPWSLANETQGDDPVTRAQLAAARQQINAVIEKSTETHGENARFGLQPVVLDVRLSTLGRFDFHEQVRLVRAADVMVTVHGNELSNMLWMRGAGSAVVQMQPLGNPVRYFSDLGAAAEGLSHQVYRPQGSGGWLGAAGRSGGGRGVETREGDSSGSDQTRLGSRLDPRLVSPESVYVKKHRSVHLPPSHAMALLGEALARVSESREEEQAAQEEGLVAMAERALRGEHCGEFRPDGSFEPRPAAAREAGCDPPLAGPATIAKETPGGEGPWDACVLQTGRAPRMVRQVLR